MLAFVFLSKSLFSSYNYNDGSGSDTLPEDLPAQPLFEIALPALIETLQIFTIGDAASGNKTGNSYDSFASHRLQRHAGAAFTPSALGTAGLCRLSYDSHGAPLSVHLSEAGVRTTCELTTYEAHGNSADIPFDGKQLSLKTITRASVLADCISELAVTQPQTLHIVASPRAPYLSFSGNGGPLSSATVEFSKDPQLLETFQCATRVEATYPFEMVKAAYRAMCSATKVSVRIDAQGVLSLQFLIDVESAVSAQAGGSSNANVAFVDFRIVPLVDGDDDKDDDESTTDAGRSTQE